MKLRKLTLAVAALAAAASVVPTEAMAQAKDQFIPVLSYRTLRATGCPRCGGTLDRIPRQLGGRILSLFFPVQRFRCRGCCWEGNLRPLAVQM